MNPMTALKTLLVFILINITLIIFSMCWLYLKQSPRVTISSDYDIYLKYAYTEENVHSCDSYVHGCCEIHDTCTIYYQKDHIALPILKPYNYTNDGKIFLNTSLGGIYYLIYNTFSIKNKIKIDEKGSNCPSLDNIVKELNILSDDSCIHSKYGCCTFDNSCDLTREYSKENNIEYYADLQKTMIPKSLNIEKIDEIGSNCPTSQEMIDEYVKPSMTWVYIILSFMWIFGYLLIIFATYKLFNDQQQKEKREQQIAQAHV
tara:strand:- start:37 stop:816 length:780 start_codon:yes stop_codon:yes gene_type:complete